MSARARIAGPAVALGFALSLAACGSGEAARSTADGVTKSSNGRDPVVKVSASAPGVRLQRIGDFEQPLYLTAAPGDRSRVYVVQRTGQVMLLLNGRKQSTPFLDVSESITTKFDEQGLLGLAFPADYSKSGLFYVDYTSASGDIEIVQYRRSASNPNLADPASARTLLRIDHETNDNHNGGQLAFGPEGDLYIGVGDGGSEDDPEGNGQNTDTLLGKILRIAPTAAGGYTIPHGNPFADRPGKRAEIWAYGFRNPWRFSFDRATGDLIVGDVGQDQQEEIDFIATGTGAGANYGWSIWEGDRRNKSGRAAHAVFPALVARHSDGYCAIIGGFVARDRTLPSLYGRYLFGDYCRPQIESVQLAHGHAGAPKATGLQVSATSSLGQDAAGHLYVTSLDGPVYRIVSSR
ncbi:MAG TPA: PQQ-dependent sugar dehydrogenase [Solirubrobacteraceae bacterium]|jgi:glucose/arabinose dehydrogenase|nr:PQQ-dependent sugar dehydrogenase [Solirubrobacteraceae bacterium]